jgi:proliferating cell nuclear antigen
MIELSKVEFWKRAIEAISSFIPEGNFRFSDKGIYFKAIDPSQIVLVDYFVEKKLFDKYNIEPNFVGIDLVEFNKLMQRVMPSDKLLMDVSDAEMKIKLESDLKRNFKLPLIDVSEDEIKIPDIKYESKVEISAFSLKELLRDATLFGSSVVLKIKDGKFIVEARGSQGTMESEALNKVAKVETKKDVTAKFSLNFLQNIVKEADNEKIIKIELKSDAAMKVSFKIGDSDIVFYLAHMIL